MLLISTSQLTTPAKRIISLVPSQTELLYNINLEEEVIGITKFCVHPEKWYRSKIRVGGTKNIDNQKIIQLNPDLIIANKEENVKEQVETLAELFPVWVTDVATLQGSFKMISDIGLLTNRIEESAGIISEIKNQFNLLEVAPNTPVAYLIWKDPYMTIGGDTFIDDMLAKAGFRNVFSDQRRYPEVRVEEIRKSGAKAVLLSSEPYPFKQQHIDELRDQLPGIIIKLVDGELFSWYGSRLLKAPRYFKELKSDLADLIGED